MIADRPVCHDSARWLTWAGAILLTACALLPTLVGAQADPFVGEFAGDIDGTRHRLLIFSDSAGTYDGELLAEGVRLPVIGRRYGEYMTGQIGFPDNAFAFRARIQGALLLIERQDAPPLRFFRE